MAAAVGDVKGAADTIALLKGIPQSGAWLGAPEAGVQPVVFADLQCPFCGQFDTRVMPTLIRDYVRKGKVRAFFSGTPTFFAGTAGKLGSLSVTALEIGQFRAALDKLISAK